MNVSKDWLVIDYDANKVTVEAMLKIIAEQKFKGEIVKTP